MSYFVKFVYPFRADRFGHHAQVFLLTDTGSEFFSLPLSIYPLLRQAPGFRLSSSGLGSSFSSSKPEVDRGDGLASSEAWERRGSNRMLVIVR